MGETNILTKEAFEQDEALKSKFGSYENYKTSNSGYTIKDIESVEETGSLPQTEVKSNYDRYMQDALNIYNKGVDTNNKNAANQAAVAGAEYRELNRNIGEINKVNGRANTGYAGDTSIDAYNAYRNSVNESYQNADKANNDLYSYYLSEVTRLQQAKDAKEESDRIYQDEKETKIVSEVFGMLSENGAFNNDGTITNETASKIWNYVNTANGGAVPDTTMAYLESQNGFSEWLDAYNNGTLDTYNENKVVNNKDIGYDNLVHISGDKVVDSNTPGSKNFAVLSVDMHVNSSQIRDGVGQNNFRIIFNGEEYRLETGKLHQQLSSAESEVVKKYIKDIKGRDATEGDCVYYDGKIYIVGNNGRLCLVGAREPLFGNADEDYGKFENAVRKELGIN